MILYLVVGGDSCIGGALRDELASDKNTAPHFLWTTRRLLGARSAGDDRFLDLANPPVALPPGGAAFLCAGVKGFKECEGNPESWRVNVDGILSVGKQLMKRGTFVVYVSTTAVEWSDSAYARQKALVEVGLQAMGDPAIVRCDKFDDETAPQLAGRLIEIANARKPGIFHWKAGETDQARAAA